MDKVCAEVLRRARPGPGGRRFMSEAKRAALVALIERYGEGVTVAALERVPAEGQQVPRFVADLALVLAMGAAGDQALPPAFDAGAERARLEQLRASRTDLLATYEQLGELERADICRAELRACETDLARLEADREEQAL